MLVFFRVFSIPSTSSQTTTNMYIFYLENHNIFVVLLGDDLEEGEVDEEESGQSSQPVTLAARTAIPTLTSSTAASQLLSQSSSDQPMDEQTQLQQASTSGGEGRGETSGTSASATDSEAATAGQVKKKFEPIRWDKSSSCEPTDDNKL